MARIVGIDLGTTNSLVAVTEGGAPRVLPDDTGNALLPSVVAYGREGVVAVGRDAQRLAQSSPSTVVASVKRLMGRAPKDVDAERRALPYALGEDARVVRIHIEGHEMTPPQVSAELLKVLRARAEAALGETVDRAVITVPAYFDDAQRQATMDAGRLAGLEVERLVNEPTAASLAYGLQELQRGTIAVYDLGGGTFDISLLKLKDGIFEVLATAGDTHLGGDDIDRALARVVAAKVHAQAGVDLTGSAVELTRLKALCERAKIALSESEATTLVMPLPQGGEVSVSVTLAELHASARPIVERTGDPCRRAMADAGLRAADVDRVVLVGGSTRMPLVRAYVETLFGQKPLCSLNPDEVVALGAAVQADILSGGRTDLLLLDVCPLSLGIETMGGAVAKLIHRNSTIPASAREVFTTYADDQTAVDVHVLQGERELAQDNRSLGRFKLTGVPPMPAGYPRVEVTFLVNTHGILEVHARETRSGAETRVQVKPSYGLTDEEVERMLIESIDHAEADIMARLLVEARVEAEQIIAVTQKALGADPDLLAPGDGAAIAAAIAALREGMAGKDHNPIRELVEALDRASQGFAQRRMDRAIAAALKSRSVDELS